MKIACDDIDASWVPALGRFTGTTAASGTTCDLDAAAVLDEDDGGADGLTISGDPALLERLRALVTEVTR